jgi:hypothetical protein
MSDCAQRHARLVAACASDSPACRCRVLVEVSAPNSFCPRCAGCPCRSWSSAAPREGEGVRSAGPSIDRSRSDSALIWEGADPLHYQEARAYSTEVRPANLHTPQQATGELTERAKSERRRIGCAHRCSRQRRRGRSQSQMGQPRNGANQPTPSRRQPSDQVGSSTQSTGRHEDHQQQRTIQLIHTPVLGGSLRTRSVLGGSSRVDAMRKAHRSKQPDTRPTNEEGGNIMASVSEAG